MSDHDAATTADDSREAPAPESDVDAATTETRSVSPRVQALWAVRVLAGVAVFAGVLAGVAWVVAGLPTWVGPAVGLGLAVAGLIWVHLRYRIWAYQVRADELYLERGVLTHVRTIAPFVRIQHVDTQRGPLERLLGLSTLVVYTAGSRGADVSIPGLTPEEARDLQRRLKDLAVDAGGGDAV